MMQFARILLFPFSLLFGVIVFIYHGLYDIHILPSKKFKMPVISVGNLTTGGTGKTPLVEYLIRLLIPEYGSDLAVLSRGYGRKTSGFVLADESSNYFDIGDEPLQFMKKFRNIKVAVDASRVRGVKFLIKKFSAISAILLDDAFQHRAINPGLSILMMEYSMSHSSAMLLPAGNLREWKRGAKRAQIIIVGNCPELLSPIERRRIANIIKPAKHQKLYFSFVKHGELIPAFDPDKPMMVNKNFYFERGFSILLFTGIANPTPLKEYLMKYSDNLNHLMFSDHHEYSLKDILKIKEKFDTIVNQNKILVTTEKDVMRLTLPGLSGILAKLPVFYLSAEIELHKEDKQDFNKQVTDYVKQNQRHNTVH